MKEKIIKIGKTVAGFGATLSVLALPVMASAIEANLDKLGTTGLDAGSNSNLISIIGAIIGTLLVLLGVLLVVIVLYAGFIWMTAQGDPGKVKKAKEMLIQAIIGLLIIFASYAITNFVFDALTSVQGGTSYTAGS